MDALTMQQARILLLGAQGLLQRPAHAQKVDVLQAIRRMGVLQIDTISVVARSPYFVLWSRLGNYEPRWLDELLAEGALFEYWSHEACFIPIEDYGLYRPQMLARQQQSRAWAWIHANPETCQRVLAHIEQYGAVRSADFERTDGQKSGWWNWKDEKLALEHLYTFGELMITRRHNFQRIYDVRQRVLAKGLPTWDDSQTPSLEQAHQTLLLKAVQCLGLATARWVADYFRQPKRKYAALLDAAVEQGALIPVMLSESYEPAYVHPAHSALLQQVVQGTQTAEDVHALLSPFDPIVWDRARAKALFDFDYRIECYTPAPKRRYGYFSLPILWRGGLVGRLDAKAHRQAGQFEVRELHFEPYITPDETLLSELAELLYTCASWHKTPQVHLSFSHEDGRVSQILRHMLAGRANAP